ncbi:MAG: PAS domain-containing protein [Candidatus Omnitrophica bacterium]|nr:PAS domain-containing protein [Candidatus Omnitrophota bacterium]
MADTIDYTKLWSPVFDNMKEFIFFIDKDFNIRLVNKSFADFTGKQKSYFIGKKCYEVMHAAKEPIKICPHRKSMVNGKFANEEFFEPSINKWLWVAVTPVFDEGGNILGSLYVATDITEQKTVQAELKRKISSLERFQRVTVDRELRMKELKTRIAELEAKLGKDKA